MSEKPPYLVLNSSFASRQALVEAILAAPVSILRIVQLDDEAEHQLNLIVAALLKRYEHEALQSTLYSCIKELAVNAVKANAKIVLFREMELNPDDAEQYEEGLAIFKDKLSEAWIEEYSEKARQLDLRVEIRIEHAPEGLRFAVSNSGRIKPEDEKRIRDKFSRGMAYDDLVTFYLDNADNTEGEGIGFALNVLLLKGEDINPALFRVGSIDDRTIARLEIPFNDDFVSIRGDNPEGSDQTSASE